MATNIPNLWPSVASKIEIQTPIAILRTQASLLTEMTHGILRGEVKSYEFDAKNIMHVLDIVAPSLENYRHRLMMVKHDKVFVYPAFVQAFVQDGFPKGQFTGIPTLNEEEFTKEIGKIIGSTELLIQNLIIRSNKPDQIEFVSIEEIMAEV